MIIPHFSKTISECNGNRTEFHACVQAYLGDLAGKLNLWVTKIRHHYGLRHTAGVIHATFENGLEVEIAATIAETMRGRPDGIYAHGFWHGEKFPIDMDVDSAVVAQWITARIVD